MKCSVQGCENEAKQRYGGDNNYYCGKHLHHMYRHGKIIEHHRRMPHEYIVEDNGVVAIIIYDNNGNFKDKTIIDSEDMEKILQYKWHITDTGYCKCTELSVLLHRFILDLSESDEMFVDHINGNKLDNRKCNLRRVTPQQNSFNLTNKGKGENKRKGVSYRRDRNKWRAYITVDGKQINLGMFEKEEDAIKAREEAEIKYFGEYRREEN